ncbi:MAG: histidine decarboxylase [Candidatus Riflebacteria bacterium]|nr:histidine decarboxylase [Candidatus Riflebacteria bacterium]
MQASKSFFHPKLDELYNFLLNKQKTYIGFPNNQIMDNEELAPFLNLVVNNIGDPFIGNLGLNTCTIETEVLNFFSKIYHIEENNYWGYITNGGTESNLHSFFLAREESPNAKIYYSKDSHYSIPKAARILRIDSVVVDSLENGEIDYSDFENKVRKNKDFPVILNANIGTTFKGAIDNVEKLLEIIHRNGIKEFHIHCDAALFGGYLPFIEHAPLFDFRLPISSISVSGHKFFGSPIPCGIQLIRKSYLQKVLNRIDYIGSFDGTVSGSRNGITVLILWKTIMQQGIEGFKKWADNSMNVTKYALEAFKEIKWHAFSNQFSNIIVIANPGEKIIKKWQLSSLNGDSHIVIMPNASKKIIDDFIADITSQQLPLQKKKVHDARGNRI